MSGQAPARQAPSRSAGTTQPVKDPAALATSVRNAVLAVPGVARLTPGDLAEVATQFAGGKVTGVRLGELVEVHVAVDRVPLGPLAEQIRAAVRAVLDQAGEHRPVDVVIDDVDLTAVTATTSGR